MKPYFPFSIALAFCLVLVFVAPHRLRRPEGFRPRTLGGIYADIGRDMPKTIDGRIALFILAAIAALESSFYPAIVVLLLQSVQPERAGGFRFLLGGAIAVVGAVINFLIILISHMNFGFGNGSSTSDMTAFAWIIPLVQAGMGLFSIAIGASSACAAFAARLVKIL